MEYLISIIGSFILGAIIGSFLGVVVYRYPLMIAAWINNQLPSVNLWLPPSHCHHCKKNILVRDNIPLVSYLWLNGKCRFCQHAIGLRYFGIELVSALLSVLVVIKFGLTLTAVYSLVFTYFLIVLFVIDWDHLLLPDDLTLSGMWAGLLININEIYTPLYSAVLGAASGYLILWSTFWAFKILTKKDGMGYGDFKLCAMLGAWLGVTALPLLLLSSAILGLIGNLVLAGYTRKSLLNTPFAFGPYLAIAGFGYLMI